MLRNSFYFVKGNSLIDGQIRSSIEFNETHEIFRGHFPGMPVVPGVCMLEIIREMMELHLNLKFRITSGDNVKFLQMINPLQQRVVNLHIQFDANADTYNVLSSIYAGEIIFFKFIGVLNALE